MIRIGAQVVKLGSKGKGNIVRVEGSEALVRWKNGDRVIRRGSEAQGTIIALRDGKLKVYWESHESTWLKPCALVHALPQPLPKALINYLQSEENETYEL
jgi:hypothetical protein